MKTGIAVARVRSDERALHYRPLPSSPSSPGR